MSPSLRGARKGVKPLFGQVPQLFRVSGNTTLVTVVTAARDWMVGTISVTSLFLSAFYTPNTENENQDIMQKSCSLETALQSQNEASNKELKFTSSSEKKKKKPVDNIVNHPGDKCLPGLSPTISRY